MTLSNFPFQSISLNHSLTLQREQNIRNEFSEGCQLIWKHLQNKQMNKKKY